MTKKILKQRSFLTDKEKDYLYDIIKLVEGSVKYVAKMTAYWYDDSDFLFIAYLDEHYAPRLLFSTYPIEKGAYKNMKIGKKYKLKELGIDYE